MSQRKRINKKENGNTRNRLLPWLVFVSLLLVVASAVLVVLIRNHSEATKGSEIPLGAKRYPDSIAIIRGSANLPIGEGLLKVTATRVVFMSVSGKEIYRRYEDGKPICVIRGEYAFVADQGFFMRAFPKPVFFIPDPYRVNRLRRAVDKGYGALIFDEKTQRSCIRSDPQVVTHSGILLSPVIRYYPCFSAKQSSEHRIDHTMDHICNKSETNSYPSDKRR